MIVGIYYQLRGDATKSVYQRHTDDFLHYIASSSDGLTKMGQLFMQQSMESYVYCILGSQAKIRWPITGSGAKSLQTQVVFRKLVGDTVVQSDQTVMVSAMRKAIRDTNVVLNMAVSPGIILVPSNMIILSEMVVGYNNILTMAVSNMKFGENDSINYSKPTDPTKDPDTSNTLPKYTPERFSGSPNVYRSELYLLAITTVGGSLISRFLL